MTRRITADEVLAWDPCSDYPEERLREMAPDPGLTIAQVAALPIPAVDRLWVLLRPDVIGEAAYRLLACDYVERALVREREAGRKPDPRSWAAIEVVRRHARGRASDCELAAAWDAAEAATWAARAADVWSEIDPCGLLARLINLEVAP